MLKQMNLKEGKIMKSKYDPLFVFLTNSDEEVRSFTLSFIQIEQILNNKLPEAATKHSAWWANDSGNHVQAKYWLKAGWKTSNVKLNKSITFSRFDKQKPTES